VKYRELVKYFSDHWNDFSSQSLPILLTIHGVLKW